MNMSQPGPKAAGAARPAASKMPAAQQYQADGRLHMVQMPAAPKPMPMAARGAQPVRAARPTGANHVQVKVPMGSKSHTDGSVSVRQIENGYVTRVTRFTDRGYSEKETFTPEKPTLSME